MTVSGAGPQDLGDELYRKFFEVADTPLAIHTEDRRFVDANQAYCDLLGYTVDELRELTVPDVVHPDEQTDSSRFAAQWLTGYAKGTSVYGRVVRKDGTAVRVRVRKTVVRHAGQLLAMATLDNIDQIDHHEYQARHDELTGLLNRRGFKDRMRLSYPTGLEFVLAMIDVDGLKGINDTHGHAMGDQVIVAVAQMLTRSCPANGVVARWSGDEFVMCIPSDGTADIRTDAIPTGSVAPVSSPDGVSVVSGISVGATTFNPYYEAVETALVRADAMMYHSKRRRRQDDPTSFGSSPAGGFDGEGECEIDPAVRVVDVATGE